MKPHASPWQLQGSQDVPRVLQTPPCPSLPAICLCQEIGSGMATDLAGVGFVWLGGIQLGDVVEVITEVGIQATLGFAWGNSQKTQQWSLQLHQMGCRFHSARGSPLPMGFRPPQVGINPTTLDMMCHQWNSTPQYCETNAFLGGYMGLCNIDLIWPNIYTISVIILVNRFGGSIWYIGDTTKPCLCTNSQQTWEHAMIQVTIASFRQLWLGKCNVCEFMWLTGSYLHPVLYGNWFHQPK